MSEPIPQKVADEVIYKLRDESSDGGTAAVDADTLFEMCVELELHRYDASRRAANTEKTDG